MLGKKFCQSCQVFKPTEEVHLVQAGSRKIWRCTTCKERRSNAVYRKRVQGLAQTTKGD